MTIKITPRLELKEKYIKQWATETIGYFSWLENISIKSGENTLGLFCTAQSELLEYAMTGIEVPWNSNESPEIATKKILRDAYQWLINEKALEERSKSIKETYFEGNNETI